MRSICCGFVVAVFFFFLASFEIKGDHDFDGIKRHKNSKVLKFLLRLSYYLL